MGAGPDRLSKRVPFSLLFRLCEQAPLGRGLHQIRIIDIALLKECLGQEIGGQLLEGLFEEAGRIGVPVSIHVEANNPALHLYRRLGFRILNQNGPYDLMERPPAL